MYIRLLQADDNLTEYMECVKDLNNSGVGLSSVEQIRESLGLRPQNILTFVGVVDDNRIVATATLIIEKKLRYVSLCCHIEDVGVHPSHRNKGYGRDIVEYCIKIAKHNHCYKVKLNCKDELIGFYKKLGFELGGNHMVIQGGDV